MTTYKSKDGKVLYKGLAVKIYEDIEGTGRPVFYRNGTVENVCEAAEGYPRGTCWVEVRTGSEKTSVLSSMLRVSK